MYSGNNVYSVKYAGNNVYLVRMAVLLGEWDVKSESDCETISDKRVCSPPTVLKRIARVLIHPQYDHRSRTSDIALVRLRSPVPFTDAVKPICLPGQGTVHVETSEGINATVAGWGGDGETVDPWALRSADSRILTHVELPLWSEDKCTRPTHFCAGGVKGVDSCSGDSGGPLLLAGKVHDEKRAVLIGVVSYGDIFCGNALIPSYYTRVEIFMPWIASNLAP
ncbi:Melanization protease 1 [Frankliniella fusca]|uniref:Melanization protease 1 n=1 Tax=Frankliniella fusca TaxID=407009 RepID=A0AAE1HKS5_9NEOP|nr:Melanization protease 1 [Frankliniella fusca]